MKIVHISEEFVFTEDNRRYEKEDIKGNPQVGDMLNENLEIVKDCA